jgi:lysophospholipase L1-like esterase
VNAGAWRRKDGSLGTPVKQILGRLLGWARDGWLILGVTVLVFLVLNLLGGAAIRLYDRLVHGRGAHGAPAFRPDASQPWFAEWEAHHGAVDLKARFDVYRAWTMAPVALAGITIDSSGQRLTVQPAPTGSAPRQVFMLGGSVMWGYTTPDRETIPSLLAARIRDRGVTDVKVVNQAQISYNLTQEVITLLLELRRGNVPKAVLFLDGVNDVAALTEYGEPGHSIKEAELAQRLELGESPGEHLMADVAQSSFFLQALRARLGRQSTRPLPPAGESCGQLALQYRNLAQVVGRLGRAYGFTPLFFWQPALASTGKPHSRWERSLAQGDPYRLLYRPCTAAVDSIMATDPGLNYFPLDSIFDRDSTSIFLDEWGHITATGNQRIADRMADLLLPRLPGTN